VGSLVGYFVPSAEVGVATSSGRAYYRISSLLKRMGLPYSDIIMAEQPPLQKDNRAAQRENLLYQNCSIIITTRKERLRLPPGNVVCVEDLGEDAGLAKEKLFSLLYPPRPSDCFVIGIDPGERTGIAAFINQREIESSVSTNLDAALARVSALIDNAPGVKKIVKVGSGNMTLAKSIARNLESKYKERIKISLVNESGTSILKRKSRVARGTRDQRAARLIAFREGQDYSQLVT
jgi:hypothetical protein